VDHVVGYSSSSTYPAANKTRPTDSYFNSSSTIQNHFLGVTMNKFSSLCALLVAGVLAGPATAAPAAPATAAVATGCAAKQQQVQAQIDIAKAHGNQNQVDGLSTALREIQNNCTENGLRKEREGKVLDAKREVSKRQSDLDKAMKKGDSEKINKRKDKLAEARKELQEAMDELDK
jgi:hypothetical protein